MKKYSMTFNVLKSSYFHQCAVNLSPSKCKEKSSIFTNPIFTNFYNLWVVLSMQATGATVREISLFLAVTNNGAR